MFKTKIKKFPNLILVSACFLVLIPTILIGIFLFLDIFYTSKFFPRFKIAGIEVGGKTREEVQELLTSRIQEWDEQTLKIKSDEKNWEIPNKELGADFDLGKTIEEAFNKGRKENLQNQFTLRLKTIVFGADEPLSFTKNEAEKIAQRVAKEADVEALNSGLKIEKGKVFKTEEKSGKRVDTITLKYLILEHTSYFSSADISLPQSIVYPNSDEDLINKIKEEAEEILKTKISLKAKNKKWEVSQNDIQSWVDIKSRDKESIEKEEGNYDLEKYLSKLLEEFDVVEFLNEELEIKLKKDKVTEYLGKISKEINKEPQNATLGIEGDKVKVLSPAQNGEELDLDNATDRILDSLKKKEVTVNLPIKTVKAKVRKDNIGELGITELIGRGESDFSGSSSSRKHNISVGASKFNGVLVAPGEEFSFNKYLGPVDASGGFLPELVIKPGKLVKEYGGGLCQVATTAFRAALYSAVPITERKNHAFAVHYYDWPFGGPGVDATIYPPHPDLRFKNDTGKYILIQTYIQGNRLIYDFYGSKGGRRAEVEKPQVIERYSNGGLKTVFSRNIYQGDKLIKKDTFYSTYKPASEFPREGN